MSTASGTRIVLLFAAVIGLGVALVAIYKSHESGLPPASATFQHVDAAPANATVHDLAFRAVHTRDSFLEDHLDTALDRGSSSEATRLRVETMRATLRELTGVSDAMMFVRWEGEVVQVSFSGLQ